MELDGILEWKSNTSCFVVGKSRAEIRTWRQTFLILFVVSYFSGKCRAGISHQTNVTKLCLRYVAIAPFRVLLIYIHTCVRTYIYTYARARTNIYIQIHIYIHTHTNTKTHTHIYIHTYVRTYIHTFH